jgi:hypothetical protein
MNNLNLKLREKMMGKYNKKAIFFWVVGILLLSNGIQEFSDSRSWLGAFKGLFWMGVASVVIWTNAPIKNAKGEDR